MLSVKIYFNNDEIIIINNVIMVQTISGRLVILYKVECYSDYTEVKYYSMGDVFYYAVYEE